MYNLTMANTVPLKDSPRRIRAKKVLDKIIETEGKISMNKAMIEAGYSKSTAHNPQYLVKSQVWKDLLEEFLPDDLLLRKHKELLNKLDDKGEADTNATARALDLAYKIKNKYQQTTNLQINNVIPLLGGDSKKNVSENNSDRENIVITKEN